MKKRRQAGALQSMSEEQIKIAEDRGIVTISLNRPERLNALVDHMRRDLAEALEEAGSDPEVRVIVIRGGGRAFCRRGATRDSVDSANDEAGTRFDRRCLRGRRFQPGTRLRSPHCFCDG